MALATLTIDINARLANIERDLGRVAHLSEQAGQRMGTAFEFAQSALKGIAAGFSAHALVDAIKSVIDLGDRMNDLSQRVGISVKDLATWTLAADQSGTSLESVARGVKGLSQYMLENGAALRSAGIDAQDTNGALMQLADLFAALPDGPLKAALAAKVFNKAGMEMIPLLNLGSAGLREAAEKSRVYGERLEKLAPLADQFNDQVSELSLHSKELGMSIATHLLPGLTGVAKWLTDIKVGGEQAKDALDWLTDESFLSHGLIGLILRGGVRGLRTAQDMLALAGLDSADGALRRQVSGKIGPDWAQWDAATNAYLKEREAALKAKALLGKEVSDREGSYLAGLREQLAIAQGDVSEYGKILRAVTEGPAKDFSAQTKAAALAIARKIDVLREATKAAEQHAAVLAKVDYAQSAANRSAEEFAFKGRQSLLEIGARTALLGKSPDQARQGEAILKIQKDYEDAVKKINEELGKIGDVEGIGAATYALSQERDRLIAETIAALQQEKAAQDALNASWEYGASEALRKYEDQVANVAASTERLMTDAFKGMEDALVEFVKTGKLNFKSLADQIISDLIRMQIQQSITKPLAQAVSGSGGLLSALSKLWPFEGGGVMSASGPLPLRRYAGGGIASGPQLALYGEGAMNEAYVPLPDGRSIPVQMRGAGGITIQQHIYPSPGVSSADLAQAMLQAKRAAVAEIRGSMRRGGEFATL